jgi:phosphoglucosamine mutase
MAKLFGTDGIRGIANTYPMTPEMMMKLGVVVGSMLQEDSPGILIGRDSRISGPMLESALTAGLLSAGANVLLGGILPTPAIAFLTKSLQANAGAVISASHNLAKDNGIKFFSQDGFKLSDDLELAIEARVLDAQFAIERPIGSKIGKIQHISNAGEQYADHVVSSVFADGVPDFRRVKIVVDCANGAQSYIASSVFERLQIKPTILSASPDGLNINLECGTLHTESLQKRVLEEHADIGMAFDGDADRVILIDEQGKKLDGDQIMAILALDFLHKRRLKNNILVTTVMSNLGLEIAMKNAGIQVARAKVGDRYVVEKMREIGANLGGEQAGHIVMFDHGTTGDGLATALSILKLLHASGKPLSELAVCFTLFPQILLNIPVKIRKPIEEMPEVSNAIRRAEQELGDRGRVFVRYSGTELLARVMVEAENESTVKRLAQTIAEEIRKESQ